MVKSNLLVCYWLGDADMKCPICGEEMLAGGLISAGISVGWVPKDEFDKKGLRRISYQEWHSIGNSLSLIHI